MAETITKEQLEEIEELLFLSDNETAFGLLEEYTGIKAKPYTAWAFYDEADNYVGNSDNDNLRDLLDNSYIKIVDGTPKERGGEK